MPRWRPLSWGEWRQSLEAVERWLLPGECLLCRRPVPASSDPLVCALCAQRWPTLPDPVCDRCGQPRDPWACRICPDWPPGFGPVRSAVWLRGDARPAVHALKYEGWTRVAPAMADRMRALPLWRPGQVLVPIPLGRSRLRERGYNQCDILAEALAARVGIPVRADLLRRRRETRRQTGLSPEARFANLEGAFEARNPGACVAVLVDDVFTTGATLVAAARALLAAGARDVAGVTFARARRPLDDAGQALVNLDSEPGMHA